MNVRTSKRLVLVALLLVVLAAGLNLFNAFGPGGGGWREMDSALLFAPFAVVLGSLWRQFSKMEAEHGPDYVQPASPHRRTLLVVAGIGAVLLAALTAFLILNKG